MNRKFIFTFILLATLSTIYAMPYQPRDFNLNACPDNLPLLNLTLSPNTIVPAEDFTFNISGKLDVEILPGFSFLALFDDDSNSNPDLSTSFEDDFCAAGQGIICPIPAGTEFNTTIKNFAPGLLPKSFKIVALILDHYLIGNAIACTIIQGSSKS
jgi:hypothetical protein